MAFLLLLQLLFALITVHINAFSIYICKHHSITIRCTSPKNIRIYDAIYGRSSDDVSCTTLKYNATNRCVSRKQTHALKYICNRKRHCRISVKSSVFGEPCEPKGGEFLEVRYMCVRHRNSGRSIIEPELQEKREVVISPKHQECFARGVSVFEAKQYLARIQVNHSSPVILPLSYSISKVEKLEPIILSNISLQEKALVDLANRKSYLKLHGQCSDSSVPGNSFTPLFCIYPQSGYLFLSSDYTPIFQNHAERYKLDILVHDDSKNATPSLGSVTVNFAHDCYPLYYYYEKINSLCSIGQRRFINKSRDLKWPSTHLKIHVNAAVVLGGLHIDSNLTGPFFDGFYIAKVQTKQKNYTFVLEYRLESTSFQDSLHTNFFPRVYGKKFSILFPIEIFIPNGEIITVTISSEKHSSKVPYYSSDAVTLFGSSKLHTCPNRDCMQYFNKWQKSYKYLSQHGQLKCLHDDFQYFNYFSYCTAQPYITGYQNTYFRSKIQLICNDVHNHDTVTWFHDGVIVMGNQNQSLLLTGLDFHEQGFYKCSIKDYDEKSVFSPEVLITFKDIINTKLEMDVSKHFYDDLEKKENKFSIDKKFTSKIQEILLSQIDCIQFTVVSIPKLSVRDEEWVTFQFIINSQLKSNESSPCFYFGLQKTFKNDAFDYFNARKKSFVVLDRDVCLTQESGQLSSYGVYRWKSAISNSTSFLQCNNGKGNASRYCNGSFSTFSIWNDVDNTQCNYVSDVTKELDNLVKNLKNATEEELTNITLKAKKILFNNTPTLTTDDTSIVSEFMETATKQANMIPSQVAQSILEIADNMLSVDSATLSQAQSKDKALSRMIKTVEQIPMKINTSEEKLFVQLSTENIAVASIRNRYFNGGQVLIKSKQPNNLSEIFSYYSSLEDSIEPNSTIRIRLSPNIFDNISYTENMINFVYYSKPAFFIDSKNLDTKNDILGGVYSIFLNSHHQIKLKENLMYNVKVNILHQTNSDYKCVFWDFKANNELGDWSTEGCSTIQSTMGKVSCSCNHMTNFAVLFNIKYGKINSIGKKHEFALSLITYIGCSLSLAGIVLTMITLLLFRFLRQNVPSKVILGLCTTLGLLMLIFLSLVERTEPKWLCTTTSALVQYLILVSFGWMLVEAITLYLKVVKVMGEYTGHFMLKSIVGVLGIPAIVVGICLGLQLDQFGNSQYCVVTGDALYYGLLLPTCLVILVNTFVFLLVVRSIFKTRKTDERSETMTKLRISASCCTLLGLTWIFGLLAIGDARLPFQYLFCILNSLQGAFIFYFNILKQTRIQDAWKRCFSGQGTSHEPTSSSTLTTRMKTINRNEEDFQNTPPLSMNSLSFIKDRLGTRNDSYSQDEEETKSELSFSSYLK